MMVQAWERGISPREFRKCLASDIKDVAEISQAIGAREEREARIQGLRNKRWR